MALWRWLFSIMPAFNARLRPKEFFGLPLYAVGTAILLLLTLFPLFVSDALLLKIVLSVVALILFVVTVILIALGDDFPLLSTRFRHIADQSAAPLEAAGE